jgi:hypothetical protein
MTNVFLSYARRDGAGAAAGFRRDLGEMGLEVWRDIEEMRGGLAWREQIRQALVRVDVVLVLLTPGAVASETVSWEWRTALAAGRRTIPLLVQPCDVPGPLAALHYHDFTRPPERRATLNRLVRDLFEVNATGSPGSDTYAVGEMIVGVAGPSGVVINEGGRVEIESGAGGEVPTGEATYRVGRAVSSVVGPDGRVENRTTQVVVQAAEPPGQIRRILDDVLAAIAAQQAALGHEIEASRAAMLAALDEHIDRLATAQAYDVAVVLAALETDRLGQEEMTSLLAQVAAALDAARREGAMPLTTTGEATPADWAGTPELSVKHRLMLTLPIVPFLLSYMGARSSWDNELTWHQPGRV